MLSLEEAIKHCEEIAEANEKMIEYDLAYTDEQKDECNECAAEHRQLAEWLKALKEIWDSGDCNNCKFKGMCAYEPELGQMVRYNCFGYARKEVKADANSD